jgi:alkylation response protein AidB-like acyl-CoA dehydrogenase
VAYAISEDRGGALPGVTVEGDDSAARLTGTKTWLAACDLVSRIVVTVGAGPARRFYLVDRDAPGVTIEGRAAPSFLPELSQGRVTFRGTPVEGSRIITESRRAADFAVAEPLHVLTALNACMLAHGRRLEAPTHVLGQPLALLEALHAVSRFELTSRRTTLALAGIEAATRDTATRLEPLLAERDPAFLERWMRDRRLVGMFEGGIRRRAEELHELSARL